MATATIIHFIQGLSLEEQNFVIEQILKLRQENKQAGFTEIGTDYVPSEEVATISAVPEKYILGVPQTLEQLKSSVESAEKQYEMGFGKSNEEVLVLPDWQKNILKQRLESVEHGNTVSREEAHKIFEQCLA